jgi:Ca-activated chloride channel family protein
VVPARLDDAVVSRRRGAIAGGIGGVGGWVRRLLRWHAGLALRDQLLGVSLAAAMVLMLLHTPGESLRALWWTPDQRGWLLLERREFAPAADAFEDPAWQGRAHYLAGDYLQAADAYARLDSAEGFYNRGNAFMKAFEYRKAIAAYEQAVTEAPGWVEAQENLALARYTLDYIERAREQSDTGEESGIGADDTVYDNESKRGAETEVSRESAVEALSAEKWMRAVDTRTADFLRTRFLLESTRAGEGS